MVHLAHAALAIRLQRLVKIYRASDSGVLTSLHERGHHAGVQVRLQVQIATVSYILSPFRIRIGEDCL